MSKVSNFFNGITTFFLKIKDSVIRGYNWLGTDGIINMETSALLVILFMLFFPVLWSAILTFIIVIGKCVLDKSRGRKDEKHDFICAIIGVLLGVILGAVHAAVVLF